MNLLPGFSSVHETLTLVVDPQSQVDTDRAVELVLISFSSLQIRFTPLVDGSAAVGEARRSFDGGDGASGGARRGEKRQI